jgi:hypothetical protein
MLKGRSGGQEWGVCQQRSQHKSKVRKVSRVAPPPLSQRKCVFPLYIFSLVSTSPLHRHCYSSQQDELRARPVRTRIAGQVRVRAMQAGQTRSCGARAHTNKHPRTETRAHTQAPVRANTHTSTRAQRSLQSAHTQLAQLPYPPAPPPAPSFFRSPRTLRVFGDLMSNISASRGRPDMRFCVCGSPRGDLSHIASVTLGCSRSDFSGANQRVQDHTCGG